MKILVTGANGMLAKEVKEKFAKENEVIATDVSELDITNEKKVMEYVENTKPEYIINCAAYTAVDICTNFAPTFFAALAKFVGPSPFILSAKS